MTALTYRGEAPGVIAALLLLFAAACACSAASIAAISAAAAAIAAFAIASARSRAEPFLAGFSKLLLRFFPFGSAAPGDSASPPAEVRLSTPSYFLSSDLSAASFP